MKIAVVGGAGALGALLVAELAGQGDEILALSRTVGGALPQGASHRRVDLATGEGLDDALAGADVVVDASNAPPNAGEALVAGTRRLLDAAASAGAGHFVGISIVGCDRVPLSYYKAKIEQEEAIAASTIPWSLLRATQFHTLLAWAFGSTARWRVLPTGEARLQPIDPRVVAARLAQAARSEPAGRLADISGPEVRTLSELAKVWRKADGRHLLPLRIPMVGRIGRPLRAGALCDPEAAAGGATFERWLADG
jgi:uncharacterized protein YbjT (DUF2867 family)